MKQINQRRILRALNKSLIYLRNNPEHKIFNILIKDGGGFKAVQTPDSKENSLTDKERLELSYLGFYDSEKIAKCLSRCQIERPETIQDIWLQSWNWLMNKKLKREQKIIGIQRQYQVSGLETKEIQIDNQVLLVSEPHYQLTLIDKDYEKMKVERLKVLDLFSSVRKERQMKVYRHVNSLEEKSTWIETTVDVVSNIVLNYSWANIWEKKYYFNYNELLARGQTIQKKLPETELDEFAWDVYLLTGNGDPCESEDCCFFCARMGRGLPLV